MRSVTVAEAEKDLANVLDSATREPVRILNEGRDLIVVSASEFEEAQEHLRKQRVEALVQAMERCTQEARENGFADYLLPNQLAR